MEQISVYFLHSHLECTWEDLTWKTNENSGDWLCCFNLFIPEFLKWILPSLNLNIYDTSQPMTKPTIRSIWPAKTQISLYIHLVQQGFLIITLSIAQRLQKAHVISKDSDQPAYPRRLIGVFACCTSLIVCFVECWLKLSIDANRGFSLKSKHYKNTPIQIYRKFHLQKLKIFR